MSFFILLDTIFLPDFCQQLGTCSNVHTCKIADYTVKEVSDIINPFLLCSFMKISVRWKSRINEYFLREIDCNSK